MTTSPKTASTSGYSQENEDEPACRRPPGNAGANGMIAIVDYGMGNLRSIANAFEALGEQVAIVKEPSALAAADAIVVPGVGAFGDGMANLKKAGFLETLRAEVIGKKKPYLGICLGMQFLAERGLEHGEHAGFGWVKGVVRKIQPKDQRIKVPHMGWNDVAVRERADPVLFGGLGTGPVFYFVHSYFLEPAESEKGTVSSTCWHGEDVVASIRKGNIFGVQFHPEKSQKAGLRLLKNFIDYAKKSRQAGKTPAGGGTDA